MKENNDRFLLKLELLILITTILSYAILVILVSNLLSENESLVTLIVLLGLIPLIGGLLLCTRIEQKIGFYKCSKCGHEHTPNFKSVLFAMHFGMTRYLKCPKCKEHSWNEKILEKTEEKK